MGDKNGNERRMNEKPTARNEKLFEYHTLMEPFLPVNLALLIDKCTRSTVLHSTIHVSLLLHHKLKKQRKNGGKLNFSQNKKSN